MTAVKRIAVAGVRCVGWMRANTRGRSPFSASAKIMRDPVRIWPARLPVIAMIEPSPISSAPPAPMNVAAESARGVFDCAMPGSVPTATTCASTITVPTTITVVTSAKGMCRRGSFASPAGTVSTS